MDPPPVRPNLDLQDLAVLGARKRQQRLAAARAALVRFVKVRHLVLGRQMIQPGPAMPGRSRLLSARPFLLLRSGLIAAPSIAFAAALALAPKQLLLKIPDPRPQRLDLFLQDRFPLNGTPMQRLPGPQLRSQPDQIFLGNVSSNQ